MTATVTLGALTTPSGGETFEFKEVVGKRCVYQSQSLLLSQPSHSPDAPRVRRDLPGRKGLKANKAPRDLKAQKANRAARDRKGLRAQKANKVPRGRKGLKVQKANKVGRGRKGLKAQKANRVPLVKQDRVQPAQQAYMPSSRIGAIRAPFATSNAARAKSWFL